MVGYGGSTPHPQAPSQRCEANGRFAAFQLRLRKLARGGKNGCGMLWNMDENGTSIDDLLRKNGGSHGFSNSH